MVTRKKHIKGADSNYKSISTIIQEGKITREITYSIYTDKKVGKLEKIDSRTSGSSNGNTQAQYDFKTCPAIAIKKIAIKLKDIYKKTKWSSDKSVENIKYGF